MQKKKPDKAAKKVAMPTNIQPMVVTVIDKPFDDPEWIYEVKWDGYRAIVYANKRKVSLKSRNNKSFSERFHPVHRALQNLKLNAVLDGEIVVTDKNGISRFSDLQNWRSNKDGNLQFYVFDILWMNGYSLMHLPLVKRHELLEQLIPIDQVIHVSKQFEVDGTDFFDVARQTGLEGIVAKKADSIYKTGVRTKDWLKIKVAHRHEVVIGGYTVIKEKLKLFSSLLVGVYKGKELHYTGKIGTGFSDKQQKEMMKEFKKHLRKSSPFAIEPDIDKHSRFKLNVGAKVIWLSPKLVCEVSYSEITKDGLMRHPSFEGMRTDKEAKDVKVEKAGSRPKQKS